MTHNISIHQFTVSTSYGDAVTQSTLFTKKLLKQLGYSSKIYAGYIASEFYNEINPYFMLKPKSNDIVFIHHALGHNLGKWVQALPCKKVLIYHNITPAKFFPIDSPIQKDIKQGHNQLKEFLEAGITDSICDSDYNKTDLDLAGYKHIKTLPLLIDLDSLKAKPWNQALVKTEASIPTILFVGRIVQNKCQNQLIEVAKYLRAFLQKPFQMIIVGKYHEDEPYYQGLLNKINEYELHDWVQLTGKIPEEDLYAWYRVANCFLCLSEHEGFGVPIVEAMTFDTPVIGFNASNVPYLLKDAGLILQEKNFPAIAALIKTLFADEALQKKIITAQKTKLAEFKTDKLLHDLKQFIHEINYS